MKKKIIFGIALIIVALVIYSSEGNRTAYATSNSIMYSIDFHNADKDYWEAPPPLLIGTDEIKLNEPSFDCITDAPYVAPAPKTSCWLSTVRTVDDSFNVLYGTPHRLNDYMNITMTTNSEIKSPDDKHPTFYLKNGVETVRLDITNLDYLKSTAVISQQITALNNNITVKIDVLNSLANNLQGGLLITRSNSLENNVPVIDKIPLKFSKGLTTYEYSMPSKLGTTTLRIHGYSTIMGQDFYHDQESVATVTVQPAGDSGVLTVSQDVKVVCKNGFHMEKDQCVLNQNAVSITPSSTTESTSTSARTGTDQNLLAVLLGAAGALVIITALMPRWNKK